MNTSPTKRRALAALDANAPSLTSLTHSPTFKQLHSKPFPIAVETPLTPGHEQACLRKRGNETSSCGERAVSAKKARASKSPELNSLTLAGPQLPSEHSSRARSTSPGDDSLFDNSAMDNSQATNITEPDAEAEAVSIPPLRRSTMTRQEAREKAEILRLRLGLATYKVRTGQMDVPLDQLQRRPLSGVGSEAVLRKTNLPVSRHQISCEGRQSLPTSGQSSISESLNPGNA